MREASRELGNDGMGGKRGAQGEPIYKVTILLSSRCHIHSGCVSYNCGDPHWLLDGLSHLDGKRKIWMTAPFLPTWSRGGRGHRKPCLCCAHIWPGNITDHLGSGGNVPCSVI